MDEEDKYWSNLEKLYVHNVYENISSKYDEFFKLNQIRFHSKQHNRKTSSEIIFNNDSNEDSLVNRKFSSSLNNENLNKNLKKNLQLGNKFKKDKINNNNNNASQQKYNEWPKVRQFLLQTDPYSLLADVGCGEGKYLNVNSHLLTIGSDRSNSLCQLASYKTIQNSSVCNKNQIIICDNLYLPFRSDLFDVVISIGVIHHLSTPKRRVKAVQELARILKPGGKIMIYVWAMEQRLRKFNCQDVLVPMLNTNTTSSSSKTEYKVRLRRDLSNNSAYSEDSNDESSAEKSLKALNSSLRRNISLNESENKTVVQQEIEKAQKLISKSNGFHENNGNENEKDEKNVFFDLSSNKTRNICSYEKNKNELDELLSRKNLINQTNKKNCNLMDNFKRFLSQKFFTREATESNMLSCSLNQSSFNANLSKNNSENSVSSSLINLNPIERYKQIIEDHKDLLPKNFTIRQFPYSSCQDTFEPNEKNETNYKKDGCEKFSDFISTTTSSSSLSPSPINQYPPNILNSNDVDKNESNSKTVNQTKKQISSSHPNLTNNNNNNSSNQTHTNSKSEIDHDLNNSSNKRYYHVFKKNELDNLIKENCPNLIIYDSYYDHGNWSICARKEK